MATKDNCLSFKDKQNAFADTTSSDGQYNNLNLNQNFTLKETTLCKKSVTNDERKVQNYGFDDSQTKKSSWKKSVEKLSSNLLNDDCGDSGEKEKLKQSKTINSSTLSLHIAAYENLVEAETPDSDNKESNKKNAEKSIITEKWKTAKQFFADSKSDIQNPFEFPRQQENPGSKKPEVAQFKASQKLLNPNKQKMPKPSSLLPPPPPPPVITLDDDEHKEDGELSDENSAEAQRIPFRKKSDEAKKNKEEILDTPGEGSDIEVIGDNLFDLDDGGCDDEGLDLTMNIDDDEVFKKMQRAAGINNDDVDISINITETPKATRGQGTCFNCGGPHTLAECTTPHDRRRINKNRQSFGSTRRERITEHTESKFTPGVLSAEAKKALNLYDAEYPQWIMRMREMGPFKGYPPAYLKRFKPSEKRLAFFCDNDPHLTNETVKAEADFDPEKIIYYEGFNLIDRHSEAERYCNQNVRKELQWKKWNKSSYAAEFEKFLKDSIKEDRAGESRKRQHGYDNQQHPSKKEKEKERKREKRAAERKVEKENKKWQNYKLDQAKEKLMEDLKKTDISKEPEKFHMIDETVGVFVSKKQRKKMDREKRRSITSLEAEENWVKTMEEETWAAKKAKAEKEELAKQEKSAKKLPPKDFKDKRAEKVAQKKAEREERDKRRLKVEKKLIDVGTQTYRVRILPWIDGDDEESVNETAKLHQKELNPKEKQPHGVNILTKLFPHMAIDAKVVKDELHDKKNVALDVNSSLTENLQSQVAEKLQDKKDVQQTETPAANEISQLMNEILDELEFPKEKKKLPTGESVAAVTPSEGMKLNDIEVVDIVTVIQYEQEKLLAANAKFQNASKSFQPSNIKKPVEKKSENNQTASLKTSKPLQEAIPPSKKQMVQPQSGSAKPTEKPSSTINPQVSKQAMKKFQEKRQTAAKNTVETSQSSAKEIKQQPSKPPTKPSMPAKQQKGKQYLSDPNLSTSKRSKQSSTKSKEKPAINPPVSKQDKPSAQNSSKNSVASKDQTSAKKSVASHSQSSSKNVFVPSKDQSLSKNPTVPSEGQISSKNSLTSHGQSSAKNATVASQGETSAMKIIAAVQGHSSSINTTVASQDQTSSKISSATSQNKQHEKRRAGGQRNNPPSEMECAYGAPLTFVEANILSRMPINDAKPKVSVQKKQAEKDRGRYKNDPPVPYSSSKKNENKGRYDSDANTPGSSNHGNQGRPNSHIIFADTSDIPDTPASPELPPVVSRFLTDDQAAPKNFLVPVVDDRKMPDQDNFAVGITPFQYDNLAKRTNRMDIMEQILKSVKKD